VDGFDAAVGMLDSGGDGLLLEAGHLHEGEVQVDAVAGAVGAFQEGGQPDHHEADAGGEAVDVAAVGGGRADVVPDAPRVVPGADPGVRGDLGALPVGLDPAGRDPDLVVADEVGGDPVLVAQVAALLEAGRDLRVAPTSSSRSAPASSTTTSKPTSPAGTPTQISLHIPAGDATGA
jgi:hypothetical protein